MRRHLMAVLALLVLALPVVAVADPPDNSALQRRIDAQHRALADSTHEAVHGLLYYPKEVRDACLEVSRFPALIVQLNKALGHGDFAPGQLLTEYPPAVRAAAHLLVGSPEILRALEDDLAATRELGKAYTHDRVGLKRLVDTLAVKADHAVTRAADAWVDSLTPNGQAVAELQRAADDYTRRRRTEPVRIGANVEHDFGFSVGSSGNVAIHYAPSYAETRFVLFNADRYPNLADALVYQYREHYDDSQNDFRRAYDEWYDQRARYHPDDFLRTAGRVERLRQAAAYERRFAGTHQGQATRRGHTERNAFLGQHAAEYPTLRTFRDPTTAHGPRHGSRRTTPGHTPARTTRANRGRPHTSTQTTRRPGRDHASTRSVTRRHPTSAQRIRRASRPRHSATGRIGGSHGSTGRSGGSHGASGRGGGRHR